MYGLKTFGRYLGIPQNLRSLGVDPADFEVMAENAMKDACAATNPRKATKDQIIAIFQKPTTEIDFSLPSFYPNPFSPQGGVHPPCGDF